MNIGERLKNAWNAFTNRDPTSSEGYYSYGSSSRPDRIIYNRKSERSIVGAVYTRIAIDCSEIPIKHVLMDSEGQFKKLMPSKLNRCLTYTANIDQTAKAFFQDAVESLLEEGVIAICPTNTTKDPWINSSYDIYSLRVGKIVEWFPDKVKVEVYDENDGKKKTVTMLKRNVAIIQNPYYSIMNEPNSTGQRLIRKLSILDAIDEQSGSGKLDLIIQLPYSTRSDKRKEQANERRKAIDDQLNGSKYGIAYIDSSEHVTQLNRPVDNNLMKQIEFLVNMLYSQLGITQAILDGSAKEEEMNNYYQRTLTPILNAICEEMERKFLTDTAITQGQGIKFFRNPIKLVAAGSLADMADKLIRNQILTPNEMRQTIGFMPSDDPKADELENPNIKQPGEESEIQNGKDTDDGSAPVGKNDNVTSFIASLSKRKIS